MIRITDGGVWTANCGVGGQPSFRQSAIGCEVTMSYASQDPTKLHVQVGQPVNVSLTYICKNFGRPTWFVFSMCSGSVDLLEVTGSGNSGRLNSTSTMRCATSEMRCTSTTQKGDIVVSGSGSSCVNGVYRPTGMYHGRTMWNKTGENTGEPFCLWFKQWGGHYEWRLGKTNDYYYIAVGNHSMPPRH